MRMDWVAEPSRAQSDDCYSRISFMTRGGDEAEGTLGWREGAENRVQFQVWDGPSFAAEGDDLATAFAAARKGIIRVGFTPEAPEDCGMDDPIADLFASAEAESAASLPRFQPFLWLLVAAILLALLIPALAHAEIPARGEAVPFPNTPYEWRMDATSGVGFILATRKSGKNTDIARYELEQLRFCEGTEDNCEMDGVFPLTLSGMEQEPVLAVIGHIGAHGQKLSIYRPLNDKSRSVFEATADFALGLRLRRDEVDVTVDRALAGGEATQEQLYWPGPPKAAHPAPPDISLPQPPPPSPSAHAFDARLRAIAAARDLEGFMALLADDVLVSFGGNGGKAEFAEHWQLSTEAGRRLFWDALDRLLARGGWNEAGGDGNEGDNDGEPYPQRLTWPWFFAAWPGDADAENAFIANEDTPLRAAPHDTAPVLARLPRAGVLHGRIEEGEEWPEWVGYGWLEVIAPGGGLGFVAQADIVPLLETRMIAVETDKGWTIEALVAGD